MSKDHKIISVIIFIFLMAVSYFLMRSASTSYILPEQYKYVVYGATVFFALIATILFLNMKNISLHNWVKIIFVFFLAGAVASAALLLPEIENSINALQVSQPTSDKLIIDIIALTDTEYSGVTDFLNESVGVQTTQDQENQEYATSYINLEAKGTMMVTNYEDYETAIRALQSGEIKYLMINESFISLMNETEGFENFSDEIKVVYQVTKNIAFESIESDVKVTESSFNVLILGQNQHGVEVSDSLLVDVVMVATVNPITKEILLTSLPRDSYVDVSYSSVDDKLTHTGIYGFQTVLKTVENVLDIDIDFYLRINYNSFIKMIDALGGVTVTNDYEFPGTYPTYKYVFKEGEINLNGEMALAYARERKQTECGDMSRNKHQRQVLSAMIDKIASPTMLVKFNDILTSLEGTYLTNITTNEIYSLMKMQLNDLASWNIDSFGVTGSTGGAYVASASQSRKYSVVFISNTSLKNAKLAISNVHNATEESNTEGGESSESDSITDSSSGC